MKNKPSKSAQNKNRCPKLLTENIFRTHHLIVVRKHAWRSLAYRREMLRRLREYQIGAEIPYGLLLILRRSLQKRLTPLIEPAQLLAWPTSAIHVPSAFIWILQDGASANEAALMQKILRGHYPTVRKHVEIAIDAVIRGSMAVFPPPPRVRNAMIRRLGRFLKACARDHLLLVCATKRHSSPAVVRSAPVLNHASTVINRR